MSLTRSSDLLRPSISTKPADTREAGIAAEHCLAPSFRETRWDKVVDGYSLLERVAPSALYKLNRAVAVAEWLGTAAGLAVLEGFEPPAGLVGSYQWAAVLADLHRRLWKHRGCGAIPGPRAGVGAHISGPRAPASAPAALHARVSGRAASARCAFFRAGTCRGWAPSFVFLNTRPALSLAHEQEGPMSEAFVWFHKNSEKPSDSIAFYESLLGWKRADSPPGMTMFAGENGPFAAVGDEDGTVGWIPYAQVEDVEAATKKAKKLGATVLKEKTRGPAGEFSIVRDPGGAAIALWQKT